VLREAICAHKQRVHLAAVWIAVRLQFKDTQGRQVRYQVPTGIERADGLDELVFIYLQFAQRQREDAMTSHVARTNSDIRVVVGQVGEFSFNVAK